MPANPIRDGEDDEDSNLGPSAGPKVLSSIKLAMTPGVSYILVSLIVSYFLGIARGYLHDVEGFVQHINQPCLPDILQHFLWNQLNPDLPRSPHEISVDECPCFEGHINVYHSAIAHFYAPSDLCGTGGMYHEWIQSTLMWCGENPQYDTVFVETDAELPGMWGMVIGHVLLFFSFTFCDQYYPCALVHWLVPVGDGPDNETGMWVVHPEFEGNWCSLAIIHLDCIA